jgi:hypothetical protein
VARDADTIQADIERARDALAVTVDEISTRANPKRIVAQGRQVVLSKLADPRIRYGLIAAGALVAVVIIRRLFR